MADLQESLVKGGSSPLQHAGTFQVGSTPHLPLQKRALQKRWSFSSPKEKQLMDVEPEDFLHQGLAGIFTVNDVQKSGAVFGAPLKATTKVFDALLPATVPEEDHTDASPSAADAAGCSNGEAMTNLLNNTLGSGMLGMGFCVARLGVFGGILTCLFSAILNRRTTIMNIRSCRYAGCKPASTEVGSIAYGKAGQLILVIMVVLLGFFCMVGYVDASADAIIGIIKTAAGEEWVPGKQSLMIVVWTFMLVPPTLLRSMNMVALLSFFAFCGGVMIVLSLVVVCVQILMEKGLPPMDQVRLWPESMADFLTAFPMVMLVFSIQAGGDVVLCTMKDSTDKNQCRVIDTTFVLVFFMLLTIGILAYLAWLDDTKGDLLENLPPGSIAGMIVQVASLDLVVLSYMIMAIPCKVAVIDLLFGKNEALQESTLAQFYGTTAVLNILALLIALMVSDLSLVLGLDGAVCTNFVAFMLPTSIFLKVQSNPGDPLYPARPMFSLANTVDIFIFVLGAAALVLSTEQLVQRFQGPS